jgi:hypothetical protein
MRYRNVNDPMNDPPADGRGARSELAGRKLEAEHILDQSLAAARRETPAPASEFSTLRAQLELRATRQPTRGNSIMSEIRHIGTGRPRLSFAVVTAVVAFAFITLVPFEYQRTVGYEATFVGIDLAQPVSPGHLSSVLKTLGYENVDVNFVMGPGEARCVITGLPSRHAVQEASAVLAGMIGFDGEPSVTPMIETVSGSLFAQVQSELNLDNLLENAGFDFKGKTDEEIKAMILERLAAQGCTDAAVTVDHSDTTPSGEPGLRIRVRVGKSDTDPALCPLDSVGLDDIDVQDKTKTDAEIKALIEQRLAGQGITDAQVSVTTDADGRRVAQITMKKDCK